VVGEKGDSVAPRRLLVVEDDARLRTLLTTFFCPPGWKAVPASSGGEALARLREEPVSVALVDLGLPDIDGVDLIRKLSSNHPGMPVIVLTVCTEERRILDSFRAGARGYLFKEDLGHGLAAALEEALAGGAPMSRAVARLLLDQLRRDASSSQRDKELSAGFTDRERQVIEQLARGLTYGEVGIVLGISANTVRTYVRAIYEKLCVGSRTEAVLMALRLGILATANP
jgi:DNA-binding NarL/FixJ family response regulator